MDREASSTCDFVVVGKGRNCSRNQLGFCYRGGGFAPTEALVFLNEHHDVVLRAVDDTGIRLRVSLFAADKEGDVLASASHAMAPDVTECLEELYGEIDHCRLFGTWKHSEIEQVD